MPPSPEQEESRSSKGIVLLVLVVVCFISARTHADPDLWGHVRFGQDILTGGIPGSDPYSYLSGDYPWINHELLAEILFGAVFNGLGAGGLVALKVGLVLSAVVLLYRRLLSQKMHALRAGIVIVIVVMLMSVGLWTIRPHLFTYVYFLLTLLLIDGAEKGKRTAFLALPLVMLVWANTHGGFLAGLAVVAIWATVHVLYRSAGRKGSEASPAILGLLVAACAAATLVNPYGVNLLAFLLRTATVPRPEISEWQSISFVSPQGVAYLTVMGLSFAALLFSRRPRRPALIAVFLATCVLPLLALRHLPLFALAFAVVVGEHAGDVWNRWSPASGPSHQRFPLLLGLLGAAAFLIAAVPHFSCIKIDPSFVGFPVRATALMKRAEVQGNLATFFDWGEYLIWHLGPRVRVSIDGRRETVYSPEAYTRSMRFPFGIGAWDAVLDDSRTDMALVGRDQPAYKLMLSKPGWLLVYEDPVSAIYARQDSPQADALRKALPSELPPDGDGLCFP